MTEDADDPTALYPAWRQAEKQLLDSGLAPGQIITHEWLFDAFGLRQATTIEQHERNKLAFLRQLTDLRDSLLDKHQLMLRAVAGVGYSVITPDKQTGVAMHDRTKAIRNELAKLCREVSNVRVSELTDDQRKENADAQAKLGALRSMFRRQLKPPSE